MKLRIFTTIALLLLIAACGSSSPSFAPDVPTDSPPIVSRVDPNSGGTGSEVTIFGFGFTISVPENIVVIGGVATNATSYRLLSNPTSTEIEAITADVPNNAAAGEGPIYVVVYDNVSNADVSFTVTP
jgi:hypothetical protein